MKTITKLFVFAVVILGFSATSFGQGNANAPTSATIITPITLSNTAELNFGNIAVNASLGTVVLVPAGTRTATGGVTLPAAFPGTITAAAFKVEGNIANSFSITLPTSDFEITREGGTEKMIVNGFISSIGGSGTIDGTGIKTFTVGATLNVSGGQVPGRYKNDTGFPVSVNYN